MRNKNILKIILLLSLLFLLVACTKSSKVGEREDVENIIKEIEEGKYLGKNVSITSQELVISEGGIKKILDISKEEFFVSISPYIENTHP